MSFRDSWTSRAMSRVAVVAPSNALRSALVRIADAGMIEFDHLTGPAQPPANPAALALQRLHPAEPVEPRLSEQPPDIAALDQDGRFDLLAGEAQLAEHAAEAVVHGRVAALVGWAPQTEIAALAQRLSGVGAAVVPLPRPRGEQPPTAEPAGAGRRVFGPLVSTYATVPYADIDPSLLAGLAYVIMFGAMFGDAGHGLLLALGGLAIRLRWLRRPRVLDRLRPHWLFIVGAGLSSMVFGIGYGEFFGPTGLVPALWLSPMEQPVTLLLGGVALGAVFLAGAYALGTVNRVRESGWPAALYSPSGLAGAGLFLAAGILVLAWYTGAIGLAVFGAALAAVAMGLSFAGFWVGAGRGAAGLLQAFIEVVDMIVRLGSNVVSFARLAAFGLMHAVLGWIVWEAASGLWSRGPVAAVAAVLVFVLGNALTFAIEALVAGIQALRLAYYELFSRVFQDQGRPFRPWHVPTARSQREET